MEDSYKANWQTQRENVIKHRNSVALSGSHGSLVIFRGVAIYTALNVWNITALFFLQTPWTIQKVLIAPSFPASLCWEAWKLKYMISRTPPQWSAALCSNPYQGTVNEIHGGCLLCPNEECWYLPRRELCAFFLPGPQPWGLHGGAAIFLQLRHQNTLYRQ